MQLVGYIDEVGSSHYVTLSEGQAAGIASAQSGEIVSFVGRNMYVDWTCSDGRLRLVDRLFGTSYEVDCYPDEVDAKSHMVAA